MRRHSHEERRAILPPYVRARGSTVSGSNTHMSAWLNRAATYQLIRETPSTDDRLPSSRNIVDLDPDGTNTTLVRDLPPHMMDSTPNFASPTASTSRALSSLGDPHPEVRALPPYTASADPSPSQSLLGLANSSTNASSHFTPRLASTPTAWSGHTSDRFSNDDYTPVLYQYHQNFPGDSQRSIPHPPPHPAGHNATNSAHFQRARAAPRQPAIEDSVYPQMIRGDTEMADGASDEAELQHNPHLQGARSPVPEFVIERANKEHGRVRKAIRRRVERFACL